MKIFHGVVPHFDNLSLIKCKLYELFEILNFKLFYFLAMKLLVRLILHRKRIPLIWKIMCSVKLEAKMNI